MTGRPFKAKFTGRCKADECSYGDRSIEEGDLVLYNENDDVVHKGCEDTESSVSQSVSASAPCTGCQLYHPPGECF